MEYLMTYGWAILIIAVVLGALFQLGVFNSSSFSPRAPPGACQVFRPSGPGTVTNINLMGVCTGQLPQYVAQFNGGSSYINAGYSGTLNVNPKITLSTWIKISSLPTGSIYYSLIDRSYGSPRNNYYLMILNSKPIIGVWNAGSQYYVYGSVWDNSYLNKWHQIVGVADGRYTNIYIDGKLDQQTDWTSFTMGSDTTSLYVGRYVTYYYNGIIANTQVYNASFSANEVQALYLEGVGGAPLLLQNLVGWWPLNGNANDYSGNNNNGVPTNVVFTSQYG